VSNQTVLEFQSGKVSYASSDSNAYYIPGNVVSICASPAFAAPAKDPLTESDFDGLGCFRGLRSALIAEFAAAVLLYGAWHLWHMIR
jgi:hypothetical protein